MELIFNNQKYPCVCSRCGNMTGKLYVELCDGILCEDCYKDEYGSEMVADIITSLNVKQEVLENLHSLYE